MLRDLFFALLSEFGFTFSYLSVCSYPLLRNASWKTGAASSKDSLLDEIYYGFNTGTSPPKIPQLREFEYKMADLIHSIEFRTTRNETQFQGTLQGHVKTIKNSKTLYVPADN